MTGGREIKNFIDLNQSILESLLNLIDGKNYYQCIPMQGSGTFAVESMVVHSLQKMQKY